MTDRELLKLAAKVAGILTQSWCGNEAYIDGMLSRWNPLTDDGDALRLAVMLRLTVKIEDHEIEVFNWEECLVSAGMFNGDDYEAATRRAIVRAAAKIEVEK